jgi:hypothetical protein
MLANADHPIPTLAFLMHTFLKHKVLLVLISCFLFEAAAFSGEVQRAALHGGISHKGTLEVAAVKLQEKGNVEPRTYYQLTDTHRHKALLTFPSSYQSHPNDHDELPGYWWKLAISTDVFWNRDGSLVAIDEYPHQHGGHVYLAAIPGKNHAQAVSIPEEKVLRKTGFGWDKVRIRVCSRAAEGGWIDNRHLCLAIGGYPSHKVGEARPAVGYSNQTFRAVVEITRDLRARVISVRSETGITR